MYIVIKCLMMCAWDRCCGHSKSLLERIVWICLFWRRLYVHVTFGEDFIYMYQCDVYVYILLSTPGIYIYVYPYV